ncbi:MAG: N-acetylmuramoyl-L-alanine amidase [Dehalococcoidia bacterium]
MLVGLDPGHGMANRAWGRFDPGAVYGDVREADVVLEVARHLADECLRRGWSVAWTRRDNEEPSNLRWRVSKLRAAGADCIVSIHCNAAESPQAHGTETLHAGYEWVAESVSRRVAGALGVRDRGAKHRQDLAILRYERPAILVELAFLSNERERHILTDPHCQREAAVAIAAGLAETVRP